MAVICENGFGLFECRSGKKCDADPVMNDAVGYVNLLIAVESMQLFEVELAAAELCVDFLPARAREAVDVKKLAGETIGVHARFCFVPIEVESGEGFGFGFARLRKRREKANCGCEQC